MSARESSVDQRRIKTTRFGVLSIDDELLFSFPEGLVGFPGPKTFALLPHGKDSPFLWLQDAEDPSFALPVTALELPESVAPTILNAGERAQLGLDKDEQPRLLGVVSIHGREIRLNRLGPIAVNVRTHRGIQLILDLPLPGPTTGSPGR